MKHLYVIAIVLRRNDVDPNTIVTKLSVAYRHTETEAEALGQAIMHILGVWPTWGIQSYVIDLIPPEHVAEVFKNQGEAK